MSMDYYIIGFLWGSARWSGDYFMAQSRNKEMVEKVRDVASPKSDVFPTVVKNEISWRLKLSKNNEYVRWITSNDHHGRKDPDRGFPTLRGEEEANFLRGYFSVHYSLDNSKHGVGVYKPRLRFYASIEIVGALSEHLHQHCGVGRKKPQKHANSKAAWSVYYQSGLEVEKVVDYLQLESIN